MQRIMVIGNCGAGKSTFAKEVSQLNGLETIHLEQNSYKPNWRGMDLNLWEKLVKDLSLRSIPDNGWKLCRNNRFKNQ